MCSLSCNNTKGVVTREKRHGLHNLAKEPVHDYEDENTLIKRICLLEIQRDGFIFCLGTVSFACLITDHPGDERKSRNPVFRMTDR